MTDRQGEATLSGYMDGRAHVLPVRVFYEDTDFSGVVYHGSFVRFFERGRSSFLRLAGIRHAELAARAEPLAFAVRQMTLNFRAPAKIDDTLRVVTHCESVAGARIFMRQEIFRGDALLVGADIEAVCISLNGRPRRLPQDLLNSLSAFVGTRTEI